MANGKWRDILKMMKRFNWASRPVLLAFLILNIFTLCGFKPLKVLTLNFNSEIVPSDSHSHLRDLRFHALSDWIRRNNPDIILLQEAWNYHDDPSVAVTLARELGYTVAYRLGMGVTGYLVDSDAILAKKSLKMTNEKDLKLPHSAFELGDGKSWVICFGSVSWAVGVTMTGPDGKPLFVYSTHLIGSTLRDRADQARAIYNDVRKRAAKAGVNWQNAHVIIGGDFNSQPWDPAPGVFKHAGFLDSFAFDHPDNQSCSNCANYTQPYFNPTTLGGDMVPSQNSLTSDPRFDYIFSRGQDLKPLASTLVFTGPIDGAWMSDHYGIFSAFGPANSPAIPDPVHDTVLPEPDPQVINVTDRDLYCNDSSSFACRVHLAPIHPVIGATGVVIHNSSDFVISVHFFGRGEIFTSPHASLNPNQSAAFTFKSPGSYRYTVGAVTVDNNYDARAMGNLTVSSGY